MIRIVLLALTITAAPRVCRSFVDRCNIVTCCKQDLTVLPSDGGARVEIPGTEFCNATTAHLCLPVPNDTPPTLAPSECYRDTDAGVRWCVVDGGP